MSYQKTSRYKAKPVDAEGNVAYSAEENAIWQELYTRQTLLLSGRACEEFTAGLDCLQLTPEQIPQCHTVSKKLQAATGWSLEPVPALIPFAHFFSLLSQQKFPAATFIRRRDELDYLQEPDIFHEIFGHGPLLSHPACAEFTHNYGKLGLKASHADQVMLARLYWFTIEFGLINTPEGLRAYGGGILSSKNETLYCLESPIPLRKPFDIMEVLRTPYRIDIVQPVYFVIDSFEILFEIIHMDLLGLIAKARRLGMYPPLFTPN